MYQAGDQQTPAQNNQTPPQAPQDEPKPEPSPSDNGGKTVLLIGAGIALLVVGAIIGYVIRQGEVSSLQQRLNDNNAQPGQAPPDNKAEEKAESVQRANPAQVSAGMDCTQRVSGARSMLTKAVFLSKDEATDSIRVEHNGTESTFKWLTVVPDIYDTQCNKTSATVRDLKVNEYITIYASGDTVNTGQVLAIQRLNN